jgi:hypothetical protein
MKDNHLDGREPLRRLTSRNGFTVRPNLGPAGTCQHGRCRTRQELIASSDRCAPEYREQGAVCTHSKIRPFRELFRDQVRLEIPGHAGPFGGLSPTAEAGKPAPKREQQGHEAVIYASTGACTRAA